MAVELHEIEQEHKRHEQTNWRDVYTQLMQQPFSQAAPSMLLIFYSP